MQQIRIFTVGKTREAWLQEALAEYEKRLTPYSKIEWVIAKDDSHLLKLVPPDAIALDVGGQSLSSEDFARKTERSRLDLIIGGPEGLPKELVVTERWSLSPLTMTHQQVRLLLVEQLYRAVAIRGNLPYHK